MHAHIADAILDTTILGRGGTAMKPHRRISEYGSEAATNEAGSKIITVGEKTHVTWQDVVEAGYFNRVRTLDRNSGEWSETWTLDKAKDNHARGVITSDGDGFLHVILSGHNTPCNYRRSLRPNDASEWSDPVEVASGTYPYFVCGPDDTLYLTLRNADRWDGTDFYSREPDGEWRFRGKIVGHDHKYTGYAAFAGGYCFDSAGVIHLVSDFYEGFGIYEDRGVHQAVTYMQSGDGGSTWRTWKGDPVALPARPEGMDVIAQSTGLRHEDKPPPMMVAQGNIAADSNGHPYILYLYHLNEPGQLVLASPNDEGIWRQKTVDACEKAFPSHRPIACRGAFTIDPDGAMRALVSLARRDDPRWRDGLPVRNTPWFSRDDTSPLIWLVSHDLGETFEVEPVVAPDDGIIVRSPKFELPVGAGTPPSGTPDIVCFDGKGHQLPGFRENQGVQNNVLWFSGSTR